MARIRTVKPDFWRDDDLSEISAEAALLAIGLLNISDDEGYFKANPKLIEADIFPLRELSSTTTGMINELLNIGYIELFNGSDGKKYGYVINFAKHQVISKAKPSEIKGLRILQDDSSTGTGQVTAGKEGKRKGKEGEKEDLCPEPVGSKPEEKTKPVFSLPLNKKETFHPVHQEKINEYAELYPAVDISQQIRAMIGWLNSNPTKRKTSSGIEKFINGWLAREQNNPKRPESLQGNKQPQRELGSFLDDDVIEGELDD